MSVGLLAGFVLACGVGCVGQEGSPPRIPSNSHAVIRTQAAPFPSPVVPPSPESAQKLNGVTALSVAPADVPASDELERWVHDLLQRGITMVVLEIGTGSESPRTTSTGGRRATGIYFRSQWAETIRDIFGELVPSAHRQGLAVCAAVSLRRIDWVDPTLAWQDRAYDVDHRQLRLSPYPDLFHPAFQEYLVGLLTDLADTGVDGMLFRNEAALGPYDGFSAFGRRAFERDFQIRVDPLRLFTGATPPRHAVGSGDKTWENYSPDFWRWAGWKARERVKILERLARAMRLHGSGLHMALEVHPEAVTDPRAALVRYGEDLLEAKRRFQYFLLRSSSDAQTTGVNGHQSLALIEQMKGLVGGAARIWITMPQPTSDETGIGVSSQADRADLGKDIGLIYRSN
jgi:hypothetical protein